MSPLEGLWAWINTEVSALGVSSVDPWYRWYQFLLFHPREDFILLVSVTEAGRSHQSKSMRGTTMPTGSRWKASRPVLPLSSLQSLCTVAFSATRKLLRWHGAFRTMGSGARRGAAEAVATRRPVRRKEIESFMMMAEQE